MSITITIICTLLLSVAGAAAETVPFLRNTTFVPISTSNNTVVTNRTCEQCLCDSVSSHLILNCFPNDTCQFFVDAPRTYKLESTLDAFLYFPRQILPNASQWCVPNNSYLLSQLNTSTPTYVNISSPVCLLLDDHGYLVTASQVEKSIIRLHPNNLTRADQTPSPTFADDTRTIAFHSGAYYVAFNDYILVVDSGNMSQIHNFSAPSLSAPQDMIFLNNGQHMIVASWAYNRLVFFNRSSPTSHNYVFAGDQSVNFQHPHGLVYANDSCFYSTSQASNKVYSYSYTGSLTAWTETLVLNASSVAVGANNGYHVSIDNSDRYWFSLGENGTQIFDSQGSLLGTPRPTGSNIFDTLITDNYVIYLSEYVPDRITRIDPNIQC